MKNRLRPHGILHLSKLSVLQRAHAYITLEIFSEERDVGEVQRIRYGLDGEVRGFELRFCVHNHHRSDDVDTRFARGLFYYGTQVCMGDAEFLCIPAYVACLAVVLRDLLHEAAADEFAFRKGVLVVLSAFIEDGYAGMDIGIEVRSYFAAYLFAKTFVHGNQHLQVLFEHGGSFGLQGNGGAS